DRGRNRRDRPPRARRRPSGRDSVIEQSDSNWIRVKDLFAEAIDLTPAARQEWIERVCGGDVALRRELETLIDAHDHAGTFMGRPVLAIPPSAGSFAE